MTLEEIAALAGVSRATVSRVINNKPRVAEKTRSRVLAIIKKKGYQPHEAARALASRRTQTIAVVLPAAISGYLSSPYYTLLLHGVARACDERDYHLMLLPVKPPGPDGYGGVRRGMVDGLVIATSMVGEAFLQWLSAESYAFVLIGQSLSGLDINTVISDYESGGRMVGRHLAGLGYNRIATIRGPNDHFAAASRHQGFVRGLAEAGLRCPDDYIVDSTFDEGDGYRAMQQLLSRSPRPEAVFCVNDMAAIGALRAVRDAGLRVPHDVALVGFDDVPLATLVDPPLTTVNQHIVQLGFTSAEMLAHILEAPMDDGQGIPSHHVVLPTELVVRASCGHDVRRHSAPGIALQGET